jgi:hypothetical protein
VQPERRAVIRRIRIGTRIGIRADIRRQPRQSRRVRRQREQRNLRQLLLRRIAGRQKIFRRRIAAGNFSRPLALREQQRGEHLRHRPNFKLRIRSDRTRIFGRKFSRLVKDRAVRIDPRDRDATRRALDPRVEAGRQILRRFGGGPREREREKQGQ